MVVAVSMPGTGTSAFSAARADAVFAMLRASKVGGAFWSAEDPWTKTRAAEASGNADVVAIAAISGYSLRITQPGRYGDPAIGPDPEAVARHILADTSYRNPFDGAAIDAERAIEILAHWRKMLDADRDLVAAMGMAWWKRRQIKAFLWAGDSRRPRFYRTNHKAVQYSASQGGAIAAWPSRISSDLIDRAKRANVPIVRVEDGFIRSVGLGSGLHPPYSIAVDRQGMHYDPSRPSDLEHLLQTAEVTTELVARARQLREAIVARGISKYGVGATAAFPKRQAGKRLVLVTGQVSDDLSVRYGGSDVAGNADLLRRTRSMEPDAEIWFRPHPDVDAGHRAGAILDSEALRYADHVVRGGGMFALFDRVDGLHVLTSLAGFEALLRGCDVTAHGMPFYGGWGLTIDLAPSVARRTRRLTLDELVAITLILYPRYLDPVTGLPCQVETLVARFAADARLHLSLLHRLRAVQGRLSRGHI